MGSESLGPLASSLWLRRCFRETYILGARFVFIRFLKRFAPKSLSLRRYSRASGNSQIPAPSPPQAAGDLLFGQYFWGPISGIPELNHMS